MIALIYFTEFRFHIIAQIIKSQLVVGGIGDVTAIGIVFLSFGLLWIDHARGHAKGAIDLAHPLAVATCEIIVDRDDMNAFSGQRIEIGRKGCHKGFTFAGFHFRNIAFMQENTPHQLHVKGAQAQGPPGSLTAIGKGFW